MENIPEKDGIEPFFWSKEPAEPHHTSDYTILVRDEDDEKNQSVYHVDKTFLCMNSAYFDCKFRNEFQDSISESCAFDLPKRAVDAFPAFLDAFYAPDNKLAITPGNAAALAFLADYFGLRAIISRQLQRFFETEMEIEHCEAYYLDAELFRNAKLKQLVAQKCAENICPISTDSKLVKAFDVDFWVRVSAKVEQKKVDSEHLVLLIAAFGAKHCNKLDGNLLSKLAVPLWIHIGYCSFDMLIELLQLTEDIAPECEDLVVCRLQKLCVLIMECNYKRCLSLSFSIRKTLGKNKSDFIFERARQRSLAVGIAQRYSNDVVGLPETVTVQGAGIAAVNGTFSREGELLINKYSMNGTWEGESTVFWLERLVDEDDPKPNWVIHAKSHEGVDLFNLYFVFGFDEEGIHKLPPTRAWWKCGDAVPASASITLEYGAAH